MENEKTTIDIDTKLMKELVDAGLGIDIATALRNAIAISQIARRYSDDKGNVYLLDQRDKAKPQAVGIHAFITR